MNTSANTGSPGLDQELIGAAVALVERVTDDHRHTVGSAIRTATGRTVTAVNLYHFTGGPCAELVALANAAAAGEVPRVIVAVGARGRGVVAPCGRCRQVMLDLHPDLSVILPMGGAIVTLPVADLLPGAYRVPE